MIAGRSQDGLRDDARRAHDSFIPAKNGLAEVTALDARRTRFNRTRRSPPIRGPLESLVRLRPSFRPG